MDDVIDPRLIKESDIFLIPLCLLLLFIFAYLIRKKYEKTPLKKLFFPALFLRFFFVFLYAIIIQFYYGSGDTVLYYFAVSDMRHAISDNFGTWQEIYFNLKLDPLNTIYGYFLYDSGYYTHLYMANVSNYMVPRFALPFSYIFFNSYICICFCLSFFSFGGCWRIFKMFNEMYPALRKKIAVSVLFLPSILFWGGSLLKDSICLGSMGFFIYAIYSIFFRKRKIFSSIVIAIFSGLLLYYIKPYILLCLVPALLLWLFIQFRTRIQDRTLRQITGFLFAIVSIVLGIVALQAITQSELATQYSSDKILQTVQGAQNSFESTGEGSGSSFKIGEATNSIGSSLLLFPLGLVATFFRPFFWEAGNPLMILSALEAFAFLILTYIAFRRIGFKRFFSIAFSDSVVIFCLVFSILFAGIVGITTTNFGALSRYKIPCLPFYLFALFIVMHKSGKFSPNVIFHKKFF